MNPMLNALKKLTVPGHRNTLPEPGTPRGAAGPTDQPSYKPPNAEQSISAPRKVPINKLSTETDEMLGDVDYSFGSGWYNTPTSPTKLSMSGDVNNDSNMISPPRDSQGYVSAFEDHHGKRRRKSHVFLSTTDQYSPEMNGKLGAPNSYLHQGPGHQLPLTPPDSKHTFPGKFAIHKQPSNPHLPSRKGGFVSFSDLAAAPVVSHAEPPHYYHSDRTFEFRENEHLQSPFSSHSDSSGSANGSHTSSVLRSKPGFINLPVVVDSKKRFDCDTSEGHYDYQIGEKFADRYVIMKLLGQGTFGRVFQVFDECTNKYYALKVIKSIHKYREASKTELRVLVMLNQSDPQSKYACVKIRGCFDYRNHVCILTDLYDISIYDFLKNNEFLAFPAEHVQSFAEQLVSSVAYIHSIGLVHTDLKPENVLLASSKFGHGTLRKPRSNITKTRKQLINTETTVIDFGSAVFEDEFHAEVVSTRHYRAPEIILGTGWSYPCDVWSIGCLLVELFTGKVLFVTRDDLEHLYMMEKVTESKFSSKQLAAAAMKQPGADLLTITSDGLTLEPLNEKSQANVNKTINFVQSVKKAVHAPSDNEFWKNFFDLIRKMLVLDPTERITVQEALKHPFFSSLAPPS